MGRREDSIVYLDTHIAIWLYAGLTDKFTQKTRNIIDENDLFISQIVRLELQYLYEIGRITDSPGQIIKRLAGLINLKVSKHNFEEIIIEAIKISWTRDVFDRIIVAETKTQDCHLVTADEKIIKHYKKAVWE